MSLVRHGQRRCGFVRCLLLLAACMVAPAAFAGDWTWQGVARVVAISDVHGDFGAMRNTLAGAGVIGSEQQWIGGSTHLVITGDLLDRGPDSRPVMDLLMRLETEAEAAGGRVHLLLGNHEVMNLVGDLRYVAKEEYRAFAAEESAEERERWFTQFKLAAPEGSVDAAMQEKFDAAAPPGFFAHRRAFRADGHYGAWLLQKPLMVVINGTAFVHGGVSPKVGELGLTAMNERLAAELRRYVTQLALLNDAGILSPLESFYEHAGILAALPEDPERSDEISAAIATVIELSESDLHALDGPLWYRGNVGCGPLIETDRLDAALRALHAERVVIGHTPTLTRRVLQRLDGRVIEIDTGMLNAYYKGSGNALVMENDTLTVINEESAAALPLAEHPRRVGRRDASLTANRLQEILAGGEIVSSSTDENGVTTVKIGTDGEALAAVFAKNPRSKGFMPELAAYRLDRLLDLGMVPVTVARELEGKKGTLQFLPKSAMNEAERSSVGRGASAWCPLQDQWGAMYIFDTLVFNPGRGPQYMTYSADNWQLMLTGHADTFATNSGRPPYLKEAPLALNESWRAALRGLSDDYLREHLGDVLDKRRLKALGKRRDMLLAE